MKVLYKARKHKVGEIIGTLQEVAKATETHPDLIVYKSKQPPVRVNPHHPSKTWQFEAMEPLEKWQIELLQLHGNTVVNEYKVSFFGKEEIEQTCINNGIQAKVNEVEDALGTTYLIETKEAETRRLGRWKT